MPKKKPEAATTEEVTEIGRDELAAAVQEVFHSEPGQIVLGWMSAKFGFIRSTTYVPGDPYGSAVNEGMRWVCVEIGKLLESDPGDGNPNKVEM